MRGRIPKQYGTRAAAAAAASAVDEDNKQTLHDTLTRGFSDVCAALHALQSKTDQLTIEVAKMNKQLKRSLEEMQETFVDVAVRDETEQAKRTRLEARVGLLETTMMLPAAAREPVQQEPVQPVQVQDVIS